jgi:hypothetical protein
MADLNDGHGDLISDKNPLTCFSTQNQHFLGLAAL